MIASLQQLALVWVSLVIGGSSGGRGDELCVLPWRRGGGKRRGEEMEGGKVAKLRKRWLWAKSNR